MMLLKIKLFCVFGCNAMCLRIVKKNKITYFRSSLPRLSATCCFYKANRSEERCVL